MNSENSPKAKPKNLFKQKLKCKPLSRQHSRSVPFWQALLSDTADFKHRSLSSTHKQHSRMLVYTSLVPAKWSASPAKIILVQANPLLAEQTYPLLPAAPIRIHYVRASTRFNFTGQLYFSPLKSFERSESDENKNALQASDEFESQFEELNVIGEVRPEQKS